MRSTEPRKRRVAMIIIGYPVALLIAAIAVNLVLIGVQPVVVALPSEGAVGALAITFALLVANHAWLMTSTELTRLRFDLSATPEERAARGREGAVIPAHASDELERRHNAHRNTTENVVCFLCPALLLAFVSPPAAVLYLWSIGFALARLGYTWSYLAGRTGARGLCMSLSLLTLFGVTSYLAMSSVLGLF
ncbi:MAPEG family protein (plasmid) [Pseudosulfitobacter pseudonitzschiae]|uniref:MAPEG family protein n=1 Tax=Pseudosulfitobacter pseudonitzschiae TaxID=1402135 RepID=A0A221K8W0_9RHOB|nr:MULTISPECIES: MAPEG family protein [Roseobacteraceae]ASM75448.1 MAPEG family protein [Pseudosulfitobacter pseudonitzschiae]